MIVIQISYFYWQFVYIPIDRLLGEVINPFQKQVKELAGDPYDDLARDEFGKHSVNFGIYGIPESILINQDLIIIKKFIGPISKNDYNYIKDTVRK